MNSTITNSHTDMAPTILQMLDVPLQHDFDGAPIAYTQGDLSSSNKHELVNVEFWNSVGHTPIGFPRHQYYNNTYKALRLMSGDYSFLYTTWCSGEHELYDMKYDFVQMHNRLAANFTGDSVQYYNRPESELVTRLDALLMVTKSCKQDSCRVPWGSIFPKGQVTTLQEAMNSQYDNFFANQPRVSFASCPSGHVVADEGPQSVQAYMGP